MGDALGAQASAIAKGEQQVCQLSSG